jgi:hypothetical protein
MTKTYYDISAVTRMLEDRENDLQMAVTLGHTLLESNDTLRSQVSLLEQDIEQTTEIVKQLKHDLFLKERLIRFYSDMEEIDSPSREIKYNRKSFLSLIMIIFLVILMFDILNKKFEISNMKMMNYVLKYEEKKIFLFI